MRDRSLPTLVVATRVSRPWNIEAIAYSLNACVERDPGGCPVAWHLLCDPRAVSEMAVPISLTREVTASIRYLEEHVNNDTVQPVTFNASLRWARDASPAPWLYFLDDDTVMHEDLLIEVSRAMREEPQCPVVWVQQLRPGEVVLGVDDVRVGSIDTGQGILNLNEVRDQWFPLAAGYAADGALFEALNEEYGGRCRRTHKILSIYNALR